MIITKPSFSKSPWGFINWCNFTIFEIIFFYLSYFFRQMLIPFKNYKIREYLAYVREQIFLIVSAVLLSVIAIIYVVFFVN